MTWTAPLTFVVGETLTAEMLNQMLRDNMKEQAPAKALNRNGYFASTGAGELAERKVLQHFVNKEVKITTTSFDSHPDGPHLEVEHSGSMLVMYAARIWIDGTGIAAAAPRVIGKVSPDLDYALRQPVGRVDLVRSWSFQLYTGLTPGTDTVRLEYMTSTGDEANFHQRQLTVMPF